MIAIDSSTLIAFIQGDSGADTEAFDLNLQSSRVFMPPVVLTEILCQSGLPDRHRRLCLSLPLLELSEGFWERAAASRAIILKRRLRARLTDTLIAQACIDNDVSLITRDRDFRHFHQHCGLRLA
jgi:predicted nucleic acid-binding protein